jgi:MoxR-like ATPase
MHGASSAEIAKPEFDEVRRTYEAIVAEVGKVVIGLDHVTESLLLTLLVGGHALMEGVPGVAKTTLAKTFASALGLDYRRIQFTPDLLPGDITGSYVYNVRTSEFVLRKGPVFSHLVLADEINRAPAKTQAALLECMQERQVTIEGETMHLPSPFMVLATQNPIEQEGVYPLPEAQVDRFLMKIVVGYPEAVEERRMLLLYRTRPEPAQKVVPDGWVLKARGLVERVFVDETLVDYILTVARATRSHPGVSLGVSPRACLALQDAARAKALVSGRDYVVPDDVHEVMPEVLHHRLILSPEAELDGLSPQSVLEEILRQTPVPAAERRTA